MEKVEMKESTSTKSSIDSSTSKESTKHSGKTKKGVKPQTQDSKKASKSGYKRGSLGNAIRSLFDKKGVDSVTFEEAEKIAKSIMPTTKFNKYHFSWYKNDYRNRQEIEDLSKKKGVKK
jgi:hypothetical protein